MSNPSAVRTTALKYEVTRTAVGVKRHEEITGRSRVKANLQRSLDEVRAKAAAAEASNQREYARVLREGMYMAIASNGFTVLDGKVV